MRTESTRSRSCPMFDAMLPELPVVLPLRVPFALVPDEPVVDEPVLDEPLFDDPATPDEEPDIAPDALSIVPVTSTC
jgi:hypothetical protein